MLLGLQKYCFVEAIKSRPSIFIMFPVMDKKKSLPCITKEEISLFMVKINHGLNKARHNTLSK